MRPVIRFIQLPDNCGIIWRVNAVKNAHGSKGCTLDGWAKSVHGLLACFDLACWFVVDVMMLVFVRASRRESVVVCAHVVLVSHFRGGSHCG